MKELLGTLTLAGEATSKLPHYQKTDGRWVHLKGISRWNSSMKTSIHKRGGEKDQFLTRRDNCVDFDGGVEWYNCCSIEDQGQGGQNRATRYACFGNWPVSVKPTQYLARRKTKVFPYLFQINCDSSSVLLQVRAGIPHVVFSRKLVSTRPSLEEYRDIGWRIRISNTASIQTTLQPSWKGSLSPRSWCLTGGL